MEDRSTFGRIIERLTNLKEDGKMKGENKMAKEYSGGTVNMSLALPADIKEKLEKLAHITGISRNKLIVSAIVDMLEKKSAYIER